MEALRLAAVPALENLALPVTDGRTELTLELAQHEVTLVELIPAVDHTEPWIDDTRIPGYAK
jgi:xylan 1,4-beta-xylosidase